MKKTLSLILALALCLSLCACGGNSNTPETTEAIQTPNTEATEATVSNEELWNSAESITAEQLWNAIGGNAAKAETYVGKTFKITGTVIEIEKDNCYIMPHENENTTICHYEDGVAFDCEFGIRVYLKAEDLVELNVGDVFTFAGVVDSTGNEECGIAEPIVLYIKNAITKAAG